MCLGERLPACSLLGSMEPAGVKAQTVEMQGVCHWGLRQRNREQWGRGDLLKDLKVKC